MPNLDDDYMVVRSKAEFQSYIILYAINDRNMQHVKQVELSVGTNLL